ncbi:ABC-type nitrate/sulfonate/bicarbonate transport system, permease component [Ketogulonicigenium vulgare]|uniref:ABC-type nitrate/sulfonate/bicarbonate transport system, permease component n=1 Tax=Ketogulonicigenium vulgare (strain WSH-001) TaxID=759362 RepID=F9Y9N6_KETVW|nr:ABC transporter permease subunit [Ketogulonicigenium vulgare]AEM41374.1 ABC-type nitrate/sulfonate/bicarbonate transport system, permease component [Ketogulonicigenium vulgare WSH-001]ALJ81512.1 nitrate ABC transporter permease [Ketogulonicigenium vulgare]AOZ55119.1 ABC-type nitrate/sulfonate/bicarbonate transport system, permease component [Ketogulonicigenium vulgare]
MTRLTKLLPGILGIVIFAAGWELIGQYRLAGLTWPPLSTVLGFLGNPANHALLQRAATASFVAVGLGYVFGVGIGFALAALVRVWRVTRPGIDRFVALIHATPGIALAPVFMVLLQRDQIPVAIAALAVFYLVYVATTSGLEAAHRAHHDLFSVLGAKPQTRFFRLEIPAALPAIVSGLKLAVPVAFMGGIVGEWFGASRGLGLLMISAMQNFQIPLLWSAVLLVMVPSLALYLLMTQAERLVARRFA